MPETVEAEAPGRVNLIGEHTDYHQGFVLPAVIPQRTRMRVTPRADRRVRAWSSRAGRDWQEYEAGHERAGRGWLDYVQGVTAVLARRGATVPGFDAHVESDVPVGAGVSSSAALTVALLRALRVLMRLSLSDLALAEVAHLAETDFVGAPVGIMDPLAVSLGRDGEALLIDTRTLAITRLPIPHAVELVVIDSGLTHQHADGGYAIRRQESFEAAACLGVSHLRDVDAGAMARIDALPDVLARRARHVVSENQRVLSAAKALSAGDVERLAALFAESHASMRDDYEISTWEIDALVDICKRDDDMLGARLTGGGFGGAVVMLAKAGTARTAARRIKEEYIVRTGRPGVVLIP